MGKIYIKGVELDEYYDFDHNLEKLRSQLKEKLKFETIYGRVVENLNRSHDGIGDGWFFRILLRILLAPFYLFTFLASKLGVDSLQHAEDELRQHYEMPLTKVRRFRLECAHEKSLCTAGIAQIEKEIVVQNEHLARPSLGKNIRDEIRQLIRDFEISLTIKKRKLEFYDKCEERLLNIEGQVEMQTSISNAKKRLLELQENDTKESKKEEIEEEFEVFDFYGNLLDELSENLKKVGSDTEGEIEELELDSMLRQVEKIKLTR